MVQQLAQRCSNEGRWGPDDVLGTLNLIGPDVRRRALRLVRTGDVVALSRPLHPDRGECVLSLSQQAEGDVLVSAGEEITITPHGFNLTHLDALGHCFYSGRMYGGRYAPEAITPTGLSHADVSAAAIGIVTRGVLLDVAAARGVDSLPAGDGVGPADLEAAEALSGAAVEPGDAVFVRTGLAKRLARGGTDSTAREGLTLDALPWLKDRDIALYSGDCIERLPSGVPELPLPLHQLGMAVMGLWFLDNPDVETLRDACERYRSSAFTLIVAPLPIRGGTASAVNPLAIF